jgi:hypothetical protein
MSAFASAARQADGTWLVAANAPATVTLPGKSAIFLAAADKSWKRLDAQAAEGALTVALGEERLAGGRARLRVE